MKLNVAKKSPPVFTHEGANAVAVSAESELRRSVLSCLLWEREFYEDGQSIAERIEALVDQVARVQWKPEKVVEIIHEARRDYHLRHVPLLLTCSLAETRTGGRWVKSAIDGCVQRADEIAELVAVWWRNGRRPIPAGMKQGLAAAFGRFSEHQFSKYDRDGAVKLRDVMFLVHPKPRDHSQAATFKRLADRSLPPADTWETALSAGEDKRETFERLIRDGQLGYLALLRNLRNMAEAGCDELLVREAIVARKGADRVLPFRYVAGARACPQYEPAIDEALRACVDQLPRLPGRTVVLVDVSGSMVTPLSSKSDLHRIDAAAALASILNCESLRTFTFSDQIVEVPARRGMAGVDAITKSQPCNGTYLGAAVAEINKIPHDRLIVITDEQTADRVPAPLARLAYLINVASAKNGVGYGRWTHIDGFSENVIRFIVESEQCL